MEWVKNKKQCETMQWLIYGIYEALKEFTLASQDQWSRSEGRGEGG